MSKLLDPNKPIQLLPWQSKAFGDKVRYKVMRIGRRGGKTALCLLAMIAKASTPNTTIWYAAPSYRQAESIAWNTLLALLKGKYSKIDKKNLIMYFPNGSQIELKGTEKPDSLRGNKIDFMIFDEVAFMRNWEAIWAALRPVLIDSKADCWFVSTPFGENHFFDLCNKQKTSKLFKTYHHTTFDNPNMDKDEVETARREMTTETFAQEFLAEFTKMSGLIYKSYSNKMYQKRPFTTCDIYSSIDFGFAHKTAVLWGSCLDNHLHISDCIYKSGTTTIKLSEEIKDINAKYDKINQAWGDSAAPQLLADLSTYGCHFTGVKKGRDSVLAGINKVNSLLVTDRLTIDPQIREIAHDEFINYHWVESKQTGTIKQVPYKYNDDFLDALRYLVMGLFEAGLLTERVNLKTPSWYKQIDKFMSIEGEEDDVPIWYRRKLQIDKKLSERHQF